ncbi:MAG: hypothetical protein AB7S26_37770 [Sandaracinaceae bacterium]
MPVRSLSFLAASLLLATAGVASAQGASQSSAASGARGAAPVAPTMTQSDVELVEPGQAPLRPLRHRFVAGQRAQYRMRINTQMRIAAGARDQSVEMPVIVLDMDLGPTRVASGRLEVPFRMVAVNLDGGAEQARAPLEQQLRGLVSTSGSATFDGRGALVGFDYGLPSDASAEVRARADTVRHALTQLLPRFPSEPIGLGATWRIRDEMSMPGMQVQVATVYRLRRWDGDRIELQIRVESGREPSTRAMQFTADGSGRMRFVIGTIASRSRLESRAEVGAQGPNGQMNISMRTRIEVEPRRAE